MQRREENDCADKLRKRQSVCVICVHGMIIRIPPAWKEILLTGASNADAEGPESISEQGDGERCIREGYSERLKMMSLRINIPCDTEFVSISSASVCGQL